MLFLRSFVCVLLLLLIVARSAPAAATATLSQVVTPLVGAHPGKSGAYVLEKGEEALRAADRGVKVRVLVDDLLIDAPPDSMLALAETVKTAKKSVTIQSPYLVMPKGASADPSPGQRQFRAADVP